MKKHIATQFLKKFSLWVFGIGFVSVLYAQLSIPSHIDNAVQTIGKIVLTQDGTAVRPDNPAIVTIDSNSATPFVVTDTGGQTAMTVDANGNVSSSDTTKNNPNKIVGAGSLSVGGYGNDIQGDSSVSVGSNKSKIQGFQSAIIGGLNNTINAEQSFIVGGFGNIIAKIHSAIISSLSGVINGEKSVIIGGSDNRVDGDNSTAGGRYAQSLHNSTWVWSDYDDSYDPVEFSSTKSNTFLIRALNGVGINTNTPTDKQALTVNGVVGATKYCDIDGANCILPSNVSPAEKDPTTRDLTDNFIPRWSVALGKFVDSLIFNKGTTIAMGGNTQAIGNYSTAMGQQTQANGAYSTSMGQKTIAQGDYSTAMGSNSQALGDESVAMGGSTIASGYNSVAMGASTQAIGMGSLAVGFKTIAQGKDSFAIGMETKAIGDYSVAMGNLTQANGRNSLAFGKESIASSDVTVAIGNQASATAVNAVAIGHGVVSEGDSSLALGEGTKASNEAATAMGWSTEANGFASTSMGYGTIASGFASTALGYTTKAYGDRSTAMGYRTRALGADSTVIGNSNIGVPNALFEIGNGYYSGDLDAYVASNAMTVLTNGNVGIGITSPSVTLDVDGKIRASISIETPTLIVDKLVNRTVSNITVSGQLLPDPLAPVGSQTIGSLTSGWKELYAGGITALSNGNVGIGTISPSSTLTVSGTVSVEGDVYANNYYMLSDSSKKTDIVLLAASTRSNTPGVVDKNANTNLSSSVVSKLLALTGIEYTLTSDANKGVSERHMGFKAEDVKTNFPNATKEASDGTLYVSYIGLIAPIVEALKYHQSQIIYITNNLIADINVKITNIQNTINNMQTTINNINTVINNIDARITNIVTTIITAKTPLGLCGDANGGNRPSAPAGSDLCQGGASLKGTVHAVNGGWEWACDAGNGFGSVSCKAWESVSCGDGIKQTGEVCDEGSKNGQQGHCNQDCSGQTAYCGDNIKNNNEECDAGPSGNSICTPDCKTIVVPNAVCGDGLINQTSEQCDNGSQNGSDGKCTSDCKSINQSQPICGTATGITDRAPTSADVLCLSGIPSVVSTIGANSSSRSCSVGSTSVPCLATAPVKQQLTCGYASYNSYSQAPTEADGLCIGGSVLRSVTLTGSLGSQWWDWSCQNTQGSTKPCSAERGTACSSMDQCLVGEECVGYVAPVQTQTVNAHCEGPNYTLGTCEFNPMSQRIYQDTASRPTKHFYMGSCPVSNSWISSPAEAYENLTENECNSYTYAVADLTSVLNCNTNATQYRLKTFNFNFHGGGSYNCSAQTTLDACSYRSRCNWIPQQTVSAVAEKMGSCTPKKAKVDGLVGSVSFYGGQYIQEYQDVGLPTDGDILLYPHGLNSLKSREYACLQGTYQFLSYTDDPTIASFQPFKWKCVGINGGSDAYGLACPAGYPYNSSINRCVKTGTTTVTGGGGCFVAGTLITLFDGTTKTIESIQIGDELKGLDGTTNVVSKLFKKVYSSKLYSINGSSYFVSETHPFMTTQGWKSFDPQGTLKENPDLFVTLLKVGDVLVTDHGLQSIVSLDSKIDPQYVYNFEVDGTHMYYAAGYLVHNKNIEAGELSSRFLSQD